MPSRKTIKNRKSKTRKQFDAIQQAVSRAEGKQTLLRFGHTGQDKFKEERVQHAWLNNIGDKNLQKMINQRLIRKQILLNQIRAEIGSSYPQLPEKNRNYRWKN